MEIPSLVAIIVLFLLSEIKTSFQLNSFFPLVYPASAWFPWALRHKYRIKRSFILQLCGQIRRLCDFLCPSCLFQIGTCLCACVWDEAPVERPPPLAGLLPVWSRDVAGQPRSVQPLSPPHLPNLRSRVCDCYKPAFVSFWCFLGLSAAAAPAQTVTDSDLGWVLPSLVWPLWSQRERLSPASPSARCAVSVMSMRKKPKYIYIFFFTRK